MSSALAATNHSSSSPPSSTALPFEPYSLPLLCSTVLLCLLPTGEALKANITTLSPLVLPLSEQMLFAVNMVARKVLGKKRLRPYIPDFKLAFEHVCIHTGEACCHLPASIPHVIII